MSLTSTRAWSRRCVRGPKGQPSSGDSCWDSDFFSSESTSTVVNMSVRVDTYTSSKNSHFEAQFFPHLLHPVQTAVLPWGSSSCRWLVHPPSAPLEDPPEPTAESNVSPELESTVNTRAQHTFITTKTCRIVVMAWVKIKCHTLKYSASSSGGFRSSSSNRISSFVISAQYGSTDAQNLKKYKKKKIEMQKYLTKKNKQNSFILKLSARLTLTNTNKLNKIIYWLEGKY